MIGENESELAFSSDLIAAASSVFDVVASPAETPLIAEARSKGKRLITGAQVHALQAALQFEKYTGVRLSEEQIARAAEFSRS
jgi:shikimate dehydrogenase